MRAISLLCCDPELIHHRSALNQLLRQARDQPLLWALRPVLGTPIPARVETDDPKSVSSIHTSRRMLAFSDADPPSPVGSTRLQAALFERVEYGRGVEREGRAEFQALLRQYPDGIEGAHHMTIGPT